MPERSYSFILDRELHNVLKAIAKRERRTINNQVAVILETYLSKLDIDSSDVPSHLKAPREKIRKIQS